MILALASDDIGEKEISPVINLVCRKEIHHEK